VVGVIEQKGHPMIGKEIAGKEIEGSSSHGDEPLVIMDGLSGIIEDADVVIDFTEPNASINHFKVATQFNKAIVIGPTGLSDEAIDEIKKTKGARVVLSPNMSIGMNLMFEVVGRLSAIMKDEYDIEIVEMHHRMKKDAPSGTALRLKEIVVASAPEKRWAEVYGRKGLIGERKRDEIAIFALRGGDVVGEHTVIFAGQGERLEVTHRAYSRENFAKGALTAAKWVMNQREGIYSMKDVLGI
jgi:4-hydroxy-tetrahydrodipicolinate reductase